jgi:hypothetical protein
MRFALQQRVAQNAADPENLSTNARFLVAARNAMPRRSSASSPRRDGELAQTASANRR